ncbi:hypothetical protein [Rubritalea tangerina]
MRWFESSYHRTNTKSCNHLLQESAIRFRWQKCRGVQRRVG